MFRNVSSINCFAYISAQTNDKTLVFFSKDAAWKVLQKIVETNLHSSVLMISFAFEMKKIHNSATFHLIKMVERLSYFAYIPRLERAIAPWFFFQTMQRQKLYKNSIRKFLLYRKSLPYICIIILSFIVSFFS